MLLHTPSRSNSPTHEPRSAKKENGKEVMGNEEQILFDSFPLPSLPALSALVTTAPTTAIPMPFLTMPKEPNPILPLNQSTTCPVIFVQTKQSHSESGIIPAGHESSIYIGIGHHWNCKSYVNESNTVIFCADFNHDWIKGWCIIVVLGSIAR